MRTKVVIVTVPEDVLVDGPSVSQVVYAGSYRLEGPADDEAARITPEDIWLDGSIRVIERL